MLAGDDAGAGDPAGEDLREHRRVTVREHLDEPGEVGLHVAEDLPHRRLVGPEDLGPHVRVTGGDPGHVAHALTGQREVLRLGLGELPRGEYGEQVRQVRRTRHGAVVLDRR